MFDYIEFSKYLSYGYYDDSQVSHFNELNGKYSSMKVSYNGNKRLLTVRGSLAYFIQGHNFWFDVKGVEKAIDRMCELLCVDLYDAEVSIIEYGVVVRPRFTMEEFINNHLRTKGYEEITYDIRGKNYVRKDKSFSLKFYSLWANIDYGKNKVNRETREMLKRSCFGREQNPMRYEIHGNVQKILGSGKVFVSDLLSMELEEKLKKVLLHKYKQINKWQPLKIEKMRRCDLLNFALALLSEKDKRYQEGMLSKIDACNAKKDAKLSRKGALRKKIKQMRCERCSFSIEDLIIEAFKMDALNSNEKNLD
jgi:hypothetical protein